MRLLCIVFILACNFLYAQPPLFDLNQLQTREFKETVSPFDIIVVGEMHGTKEVPEFVLQLASACRKDNKPLTIGLEIEKNYQLNVDAFLKDGDLERLTKQNYFQSKDGRTSEAMGELLRGIHAMKNVKVVCFDVESKSAVINRDSAMARNLLPHLNEGRLIVLTGNLHSNLKEGYWRPGFKSATFYLNQWKNSDTKLISLNTYFGGGTIWNCMSDGCKEREAFTNREISEQYKRTNFLVINDANHIDSMGYNGSVYFEKVTASKPLVP